MSNTQDESFCLDRVLPISHLQMFNSYQSSQPMILWTTGKLEKVVSKPAEMEEPAHLTISL